MKYNRILGVLLFCMSIVCLSGCTQINQLSDSKSDLIAEYSAGVLLRYSDQYDKRLITKEQAAEESTESPAAEMTPPPEATPTSVVAAQSTAPDISQTNDESTVDIPIEPSTTEVSMNKLYHVNGLDFSYKSFEYCGKYPKKSKNSQIIAPKGETLLIVKFQVENKTKKAKKVNLMRRKIDYMLTVDGNEYQPSISILENGGLNYLNTTIAARKSETAVLVYNLSSKRKQASDLSLQLKDGTNTTSIKMK